MTLLRVAWNYPPRASYMSTKNFSRWICHTCCRFAQTKFFPIVYLSCVALSCVHHVCVASSASQASFFVALSSCGFQATSGSCFRCCASCADTATLRNRCANRASSSSPQDALPGNLVAHGSHRPQGRPVIKAVCKRAKQITTELLFSLTAL